jgi:hypothetical protein
MASDTPGNPMEQLLASLTDQEKSQIMFNASAQVALLIAQATLAALAKVHPQARLDAIEVMRKSADSLKEGGITNKAAYVLMEQLLAFELKAAGSAQH